MNLVLAIALLAQVPDGDVFPQPATPPTAVEVARLDLGFSRAVEESIAREPGTSVPDAYAGLIALLGCDSYRGRADASTRLESAVRKDRSAIRWLFWGRRHHDPEVRSRCNAIIRRLNPCPTCRGTRSSAMGSGWPCGDCQSWDAERQDYVTVSPWPYSPWD